MSWFTPAPGTNYSVGSEPEIARRLNALGAFLHRHLTGISGYRTPGHSVAVGGFANDPHTRGQASDTGGVERVPESTLERFGLTRPFSGGREANHIQLLHGGSNTPRRRGRGAGPADWLAQAGWPSNLIPIMVAIGGAESHWNIGATHTNNDGTTDDGWLQENSSNGFDRNRLRTDPVYAARAAKQTYKKQGLGAWTTYTSGAYKSFMGETPSGNTFGRTRPGGDVGPNPDGPDNVLAAWFGGPLLEPNLVQPPGQAAQAGKSAADAAKKATGAVNGVTDFLKWISWLFHPLNILRIVEFQVGAPMIGGGIAILISVWKGSSRETSMKLKRAKGGAVKRATKVVSKSPGPAGKAAKVAIKLDK